MKARENQLKQNASELPDLLRPWLPSSRKGDKKTENIFIDKKQSKNPVRLKRSLLKDFAVNVRAVHICYIT
jgi:hypothetical protein